MTKELTAKELARVASTVTGRDWEVIDGAVCLFIHNDESQTSQHAGWLRYWIPKFTNDPDGDDECSDQALAVVEWLADAIKKLPDRESIADNIMFAVRRKDTTALMRMVLELHGDTAP